MNILLTESSFHDPRALTCLEQLLSGIALPQRALMDLATLLVPKEIFIDETNELQSKIELLQKQLVDGAGGYTLKREGTQTSMSTNSNDEMASPTEPAKAVFFGKDASSVVPLCDVPTTLEIGRASCRERV